MNEYIADIEHYEKLIARVQGAKRLLWIATADLKDLYVRKGANDAIPFLSVLNDLVKRGVEVRLLHAKEPGLLFVMILINIQLFGRVCKGDFALEYT